jgi:hypothetical protein
MGGTTYSAKDWDSYKTTTSKKTVHEVFKEKRLADNLNPKNITVRESRDSTVNPETTPVVVALDVTGSMGILAHKIATKGLGLIFEELLKRKPVIGPQFAFMGIGDAQYDRAPLQVSQFESDTASLVPQLESLFLEGGGGGNRYESYNLVWYFAATRIVHDAAQKRNKKGYLFTVGDEEVPPDLTEDQLRSVFGQGVAVTNEDLLSLVSKQWNVFHIMVEQGSHMRWAKDEVIKVWSNLLGQHAICLSEIDSLAEVIVSAIEMNEGKDLDTVVKSWDGSTAMVVSKALEGFDGKSLTDVSGSSNGGIVRF